MVGESVTPHGCLFSVVQITFESPTNPTLLQHVCPLLSLDVVVDLPLYFPRDQPTLTFQSVYHFTSSGQLYSQVQTSYPYSPRWNGNEMAKRAKYVKPASW